jgi:HlyD family secretion protein
MDAQTTPPAPPAVRMSWPKRIFSVLFVLAIVGVVAASLKPRMEPPATVQATAARKGAITRVVTAGGKLQAATEVKLSSNITGDLVDLTIREGDRVTRGQVLGHIDTRRYGAQLNQSEAARNSAAAEAEVLEVRAAQLKADLARVNRLLASQNASAAEAEKARADYDGARAQAAAAGQRLAQADAALREARHQYSLTTLTAPIDGIVTQRLKQVGERVRGSDFSEDVLMVISTLSKMEMKMEVGEHEVVYVKEGDPAEIEIDAFVDRKFKAQVVEVARNATIKNAGTEQEVTTFVVRLALVDQVVGALPGMSAQASVSTDTRNDAVVVPIQAVTVRTEKDLAVGGASPEKGTPQPPAAPAAAGKKVKKEKLQKLVFVVVNGEAKARPVETGLASDTEIEIVSGVKEGDQVIDGPYRILSRDLADGKKVTVEVPGGKPGDKPTDKAAAAPEKDKARTP